MKLSEITNYTLWKKLNENTGRLSDSFTREDLDEAVSEMQIALCEAGILQAIFDKEKK